jgi:hypothetical protein
MNPSAVAKELRTRLALDHRSERHARLARHCLEQSAREGSKPSEDARLTLRAGLGPNQAFTPARPAAAEVEHPLAPGCGASCWSTGARRARTIKQKESLLVNM